MVVHRHSRLRLQGEPFILSANLNSRQYAQDPENLCFSCSRGSRGSGPGAKAISPCLDPAAQTRLSALQVRFESDRGAQTRFISRNARNGEEMSALRGECGD